MTKIMEIERNLGKPDVIKALWNISKSFITHLLIADMRVRHGNIENKIALMTGNNRIVSDEY